MKVAFVFMHPFSESMGSVVRVRELALSLGKAGIEVYIFTPYERSFDLFPNVHVVSMNNLVNSIGASNLLYRFSKFLYYNRAFPSIFSKFESQSNVVVANLVNALAKLVTSKSIDVIQVEQDAALPIAIGLKDKVSIPVVMDVHNISSEELAAAGLLKKPGDKFSALQDMTRRGFSKMDHVVVVSDYMKDYVISNYGLGTDGVSVVPPGGRLKVNESVLAGRGNPPKVVYAGLVAPREHVDLFVRSIPVVSRRHPDAEFYITQKGEDVSRIKKLANDLGVKPKFFWYNDYEAVNFFLSSCNVGVLSSSSDLARQMGTPAKLFTYLSLGLPVVANGIGGWTNIIKSARIGSLTSDDPEEFGAAISNILDSSELQQEYASNGMALVANGYNWDNSAQTLLGVYKSLIN